MLRERDPHFNREAQPLPSELTDQLLESRFLVRRGDQLLFRHDLVRAFLAARYLAERWRDHVRGDLEIDSNWKSVLEFVILGFEDASDAKELLLAVLEKNSALAGELFKVIEASAPKLCVEWTAEFKFRYAEATLATL